ncbi:hypothetical protein SOVF_205830, partial [Spinacia oleracea]
GVQKDPMRSACKRGQVLSNDAHVLGLGSVLSRTKS